MSTRMIRTLALAVGAGALIIGTAAPAMALDAPPLPGKMTVTAPNSVTVKLANPAAPFACGQAAELRGTGWSTRVVGQPKSGVTVSAVTCNGAEASWQITVAAPTTKSGKANAVVKFIATTPAASVDASPITNVYTLVLKVNHKTGKPA